MDPEKSWPDHELLRVLKVLVVSIFQIPHILPSLSPHQSPRLTFHLYGSCSLNRGNKQTDKLFNLASDVLYHLRGDVSEIWWDYETFKFKLLISIIQILKLKRIFFPLSRHYINNSNQFVSFYAWYRIVAATRSADFGI